MFISFLPRPLARNEVKMQPGGGQQDTNVKPGGDVGANENETMPTGNENETKGNGRYSIFIINYN